jgi:hypothetical protein
MEVASGYSTTLNMRSSRTVRGWRGNGDSRRTGFGLTEARRMEERWSVCGDATTTLEQRFSGASFSHVGPAQG